MPASGRDWLSYARADLDAARILARDGDVPGRIACFHAQQAAEKALKAALVAEAVPFKRTHDVVVLVGLLPTPLADLLASVDLLVLQP